MPTLSQAPCQASPRAGRSGGQVLTTRSHRRAAVILGPVNLGLVLLSAFTSGLATAVGIGGGTLLILAMAQAMPATALIPRCTA